MTRWKTTATALPSVAPVGRRAARLLVTCGLVLALAGCAGQGREPTPVAVQHSNDVDKNCAQLSVEIYDNHIRSGDRMVQARGVDQRNVYFGVAIPFSLSMDFSAKERREAQRFRLRRDYLKGLFDKFGCVGYLGF